MGFQRRTILAAVDGSPSSYRAGALAVHMARVESASLIGVFVHAPSTLLVGTVPGADVAAYKANADLADELRTLASVRAQFTDVRVQFMERRGDPCTEILSVAAQQAADLIVVGASASPLHRVAGSLAARLIRNGRWPVTVVP
ncbi:universal stress protein [Gryllotalpicola reticulitermitis]|uniref:Universal stress protein n=1 Tax=Gryllotalpicola reticulitermitis TaxID=1184153 RepID=A0ABV8QAQ6_9MICO